MAGTIGPHEGREHLLMTTGQKKIAYFSETDPADAFAASVAAGAIKRFVWTGKRKIYEAAGYPSDVVARVNDAVVYYLPGEEGLKDELLRLVEERFAATTAAERRGLDACIGRLLGYGDDDILAFLRQSEQNSK